VGVVYLVVLLYLTQHDDGAAAILIHHPPEINHRVVQAALSADVGLELPVALETQGEWQGWREV